MAVVHRCWTVDVMQARAALADLRTLDDLVSPAVTTRMRIVGEDPKRSALLVTARLDPRDEESWARDLEPSSDDYGFHRSGAARLTVLLASVCGDASGLSVPPAFVEAHLEAARWPPKRIEVCLRGQPVSSLFEFLSPALGEILAQCRPWLVGGWLDYETASELIAELSESASALDHTRHEVAGTLSDRTGLNVGEIHALLRKGIADLRLMLSEASPSSVLWIIQD